ncbi:hypothetical protein BCR42DRAFT_326500 [Absidia repens]|uniref:Gamma-soluble NSF attachment protein n=1 Tax=Absidia repens TaxID=90262 RepID=A0A1X2IIM5_9FUNG|nr:hypothetical protein BCR42DRAFT_326500 [Absidia repens]
MEAERIREGVKLMQEGEKASTKGLFRKPDWDVAASCFERAATSFKIARSYDQAVQAYTKTSEAYFKADGIHLAGKAMENAGFLLAQNLNQSQRAAEAYKQASDLFMADGKMDRAAEQLEKAARSMENVDVNAAIELYSSACSLFEQEDRGRFAQEIFKKAISLSVRSRKYAKAIELIHRQCHILQKLASRTHVYKANLSLLIILFALGDEVEAGKQFNTMCANEEADIGQSLLQAYDEVDQVLLEKTVRRQQVSFLDNEVAKLSRTLTVPGESLSAQPPSSSYRPTPTNQSYPYKSAQPPPPPPQTAYGMPSQTKEDIYNRPPPPSHHHQQSSSPPPPPHYSGPQQGYPAEKQQHHPPVTDVDLDEEFARLNTNPSYQQNQPPRPDHHGQHSPYPPHPPPFQQADDDDDDLR